ncbi:phosphodiester glycosidase family protein [Aestuariibius insulae]|uniref:phosphodiester glycosidase family protein n=1 Tax=Aestuariibius insulae TaxID=2058287 RepID=UPI00345EC504
MIRPLLALLVLAGPAAAVECDQIRFDGKPFTICEVDPGTDRLGLFLKDEEGALHGHFNRLDAATEGNLVFAMNAGMYHGDRRPVGHFIADGTEEMRVISSDGPGNFGLLPNGILCLAEGRAQVIETLRFLDEAPVCSGATQSGPMLVIDGALHPRFLEGSDSLYIRNGVGTSVGGDRAVFAISDVPVNFHTFARLFRDGLELPQALYFDGNVSRLHAPQMGRSDFGPLMGPIVAVTDPSGTD